MSENSNPVETYLATFGNKITRQQHYSHLKQFFKLTELKNPETYFISNRNYESDVTKLWNSMGDYASGTRKMKRSDSLMIPSEIGIKKHIRKSKLLPKYLEKSKIDEMLERARNDNKRNYLILLTLWRTGIRNSELINLKKRDLKVDELTIRQGKGHKDRIVPLDYHLSDLLQYHTAKIPLDNKVFPLTSAQIRNISHRYQSKDEVVKPHTFRHSFAVHCLKQGMNLRSLQKILGHNDLATTAVYLDLIAKDIKEDYQKIQW